MRSITIAVVVVAVALAAGGVRCDPITRLNAILEDVIQRTNRIVATTEDEVFADLDRVQAELRQRTLGTRVTGDITGTNLANRHSIDALIQRTLAAIVKAERDFDVIYQAARVQIRRENAGSPLEPFIISALRRIDQIVQRAIRRINALAERARVRVNDLTDESATQLQRLHDEAVAARPANDAYYQQRLAAGVEPAQQQLRNALEGAKNDINGEVQTAETQVRREAQPAWAAAHLNRDVTE